MRLHGVHIRGRRGDPSARLLRDAVLGIAASLEVVILRGPGQDVSRDLLAVSDRAVIHGSRHAQAPEALVRRRADRIHAGAGKRQRPTDREKCMHARQRQRDVGARIGSRHGIESMELSRERAIPGIAGAQRFVGRDAGVGVHPRGLRRAEDVVHDDAGQLVHRRVE